MGAAAAVVNAFLSVVRASGSFIRNNAGASDAAERMFSLQSGSLKNEGATLADRALLG